MVRHLSTIVLVVLGMLILSLTIGGAAAQGAESDNSTFLDRLDRFGRNVFGGLFPTDKQETEQSYSHPQPKPQRRAMLDLDEADAKNSKPPARVTRSEPRDGDRMYYRAPVKRGADEQSSAEKRPAATEKADDTSITRAEPQRPTVSPPPAVEQQPANEKKPDLTAATQPIVERPTPAATLDRVAASDNVPVMQPLPGSITRGDASDSSNSASLRNMPLYQRMSRMRQSPFSEPAPAATTAPAESNTAAASSSGTPTVVRAAPATTVKPETASRDSQYISSLPTSTKSEPTPARSESRPINVLPTPAGIASAESAKTTVITPAAPSTSVQTSPAFVLQKPSETPASNRSESTRNESIRSEPSRSEPSGGIVNLPRSTIAGDGSASMLLTRQSPNLRVETVGPRRITVGKESTYEITVLNSGEVAAEELVVTVDLPAWADVRGSEAALGRADIVSVAGGGRQLVWKVGRLDAQGRQRISLRIVPRESKAFELAVKWDFRQASSQAAIEVQEPKLVISVEGPREVLFGKKELYRIKVANTGTGDAENVLLKLWPVGCGPTAAASQALGNLAPGEQRLIEAELTARQVGNLTMKAEALCDGNIRAEVAEPVAVLRANLQVQVDGARHQFVGTTGTYRVRVVNPGTAPAQNVTVQALLPADVKCVGASHDGQIEQSGSLVRWKLGSLAPAADKALELKCLLGRAGDLRLEIAAAAEDDIRAVAAARTEVEAMADLTMEVVDPHGAVATGEDAVYELRIRNRGSMGAEGVEVAAFFSQGIEPVHVEGAPHRISVGQVTFSPIASLPAGKEVQLKIVARAQTAGTHIFRAEVHCRPLGVRLASEETTRFYVSQDGPAVMAGGAAGVPYTADQRNGAAPSSRTQPGLPLQR